MALTTSMPPVTLPKTTCLPSSQSVLTVHLGRVREWGLRSGVKVGSGPGQGRGRGRVRVRVVEGGGGSGLC